MITIAVCDDEKTITSQIETFLYDISQREGIPVEIDVFYSGHDLEQQISGGKRYDLIYLDIQMEGGDGISTAEQIRKTDENALLIYVSGYEKYMMELFRLNVLAFIKKPIEKALFEQIFLNANQRICKQRFYFVYQYQKAEYKIPCIDILYFESRGRKIIIHLKENSTDSFNGKLSEVERQLNAGKIPFLRIHKSYYVNYHYIKARTRTEITLTDGTRLPVSKALEDSFGNQYGRLLGGEIDG